MGLVGGRHALPASFQARLLSSVVSQRVGRGGICSFLAWAKCAFKRDTASSNAKRDRELSKVSERLLCNTWTTSNCMGLGFLLRKSFTNFIGMAFMMLGWECSSDVTQPECQIRMQHAKFPWRFPQEKTILGESVWSVCVWIQLLLGTLDIPTVWEVLRISGSDRSGQLPKRSKK